VNPYGGGNANPGGPGGRRQKINPPYRGRPTNSHRRGGGGGGDKKKGCCSMVAALHSVKQGNLTLARRYGRITVRVLGQRMTGRPVGVWA
jgi:hypothetical protein